jgi:hypothetical protein
MQMGYSFISWNQLQNVFNKEGGALCLNLMVGSIALCLLYVGWRDYSKGNKQDGILLKTFGAFGMLLSIGLYTVES